MNVLFEIATYVSAAFAGFMWGRLHELKYGYYRQMFSDAIDGWRETADLLIEERGKNEVQTTHTN